MLGHQLILKTNKEIYRAFSERVRYEQAYFDYSLGMFDQASSVNKELKLVQAYKIIYIRA